MNQANLFPGYGNGIKKTWRLLNSLSGGSNNKSPMSDLIGEQKVNDTPVDGDTCPVLQKCVLNLYQNTNYESASKSSSTLCLYPTDYVEIVKITQTIKPKKCTGEDRLYMSLSCILKHINEERNLPLVVVTDK
jgi:hypothetical protein